MPENIFDAISLNWAEVSFRLQERQEISRTADGRVQGRDLGPAVWIADFRSAPVPFAQARAAMAQMRALRGVAFSFYAHDPVAARPSQAGPNDLDGSAPQVHSLSGGELQISGLPNNLALSPGDYLSIHTSTSGRDLHQVVRGGQSDISGVTPAISVSPPLRPQVQTGQAVALVNPVAEFLLQPDTLDDPMIGAAHRAITFSAVQVLR